MNYEKKYKEVLSRAKDMLSNKEIRREDMEYLFPELKENKDKKIRKWLLDFVQGLPDEGLDFNFYNLSKEQVIAWLEKQRKPIQDEIEQGDIKEQLISYFRAESRDVPHRKEIHDKWISWIEKQGQGEQKTAWNEDDEEMYRGLNHLIYSISYCDSRKEFSDWLNSLKDRIQSKSSDKPQGKTALEAIKEKPADNANKVRSKFHEGDWLVAPITNRPVQIVRYEERSDGTLVWFSNGTGTYVDFLCNYHLWTIRDAKDGDVLVDGDTPFIFKGLIDPHHPGQPVAYCGIDCENNFIVGSGSKGGTHWWCRKKKVKPATKEQRDLLFTKMKEAGYEWIDYKKELVCAKN